MSESDASSSASILDGFVVDLVDIIVVRPGSPSQPGTAFENLIAGRTSDVPFVDVLIDP
jgi:hypothetical protein